MNKEYFKEIEHDLLVSRKTWERKKLDVYINDGHVAKVVNLYVENMLPITDLDEIREYNKKYENRIDFMDINYVPEFPAKVGTVVDNVIISTFKYILNKLSVKFLQEKEKNYEDNYRDIF